MQPVLAAAVPDRDHPTRTAAHGGLVGLHRQHQPSVLVTANVENVHAGHVEQGIGPDAPTRTRPARRVAHVGAFTESVAWSLPILKAPTPLSAQRHAHQSRHPTTLKSEEPAKRYPGS